MFPSSLCRSSALLLVLLVHITQAALLTDLPRFNLYSFSSESSDLGSYKAFTCSGGVSSADTEERSCELYTGKDGLVAYAYGAGFYSGLGFLAAVFLSFGSFVFFLYSICKFTCCDNSPVEKTRVRPRAAGAFFVCLVIILTCFCLSTFKGNYAITENTSYNEEYNAANSLHGLKNIIHTFEPSATHTVLSLTSDVMRPAVVATNNTFNDAVSIDAIIDAFQMMNITIPKLPDPHGVLAMLNTTKTTAHNSSAHIDFILANLNDIDVLVYHMLNDTEALRNQTLNLTAINEDIADSISALNATIVTTLSFLNDIVGDDGVVAGGVSDLHDVQRVDDGGLLPNSAVFHDASTGDTGSTARLISGDLNAAPAEITLMNNKLLAIDKNMSALPNYTLTADQLVYLNNSINDALSPNGLMHNLTSLMFNLANDIKEPIPILHDIMDSISSFQGNLDDLTVEMADTVHVVRVMLPLIETLLPQFDFLDREANKMYASEGLLPVLDIMVDQFVSINETLFVLTDNFNDMLDSMDDVNATVRDFLYNGTLSDILIQIEDANKTVLDALADASEELDNLEDFQEVLQDSINDYNISDINETVSDAIELLQDIDFNDTYTKVKEFEAALAAVVIDEAFVSSLYILQDKLDLFLGMLDTAVGPFGDYILLAQGYCTGRQDVYCSVDADCAAAGGTTCSAPTRGTYRCATPIGATMCTADADCTAVDASSYCLADSTRGGTLHAVLVAFADNSTDLDVSGILEDLEEILASSDVNLTDSTRMLEDGAESIDVFNTTDVLTLIRDIESGIDDFDTASIRDQLQTTQSSIDDVDFDGFMSQIEGNLDLYDRVSNNTFIEKWIETFETAKDFMFKDVYLKRYMANVESSVLVSVLSSQGPSAAFGHIGRQIDQAMDDFRRNQSGINVKDREPFASRYEDSYEVLDRAGASRYPTTQYATNDLHGALYYLLALYDNYTVGNTRTVPHDHPLARGVFANAEGYKYEDEYINNGADDETDVSVYCLTVSCFEYTMEIVNTAPLGEVVDELFPPSYDEESDDEGSVLDGANISREQLMTFLWMPVLFLFLIGIVVLASSFFPTYNKTHVRCNCCFLTCALIILPFMFMFASIFFFLAVVGEDSCTTGTAIGESYLTSFGDEFCEQKLKGTGSLADCRFNWTLGERFGEDENITISLNVLDTYNALFQQQCDSTPDPFEKIALELAEQVQRLPLKATDKALAGSDYDLRPALQSIVNTTAVNYGQVMYDLIAETNVVDVPKVMSCESMSLVYADMEETGCEGVVHPGAWLIAPWYVVCWAICCCGIPASCSTLVQEDENADADDDGGSDDYSDSAGDDDEYSDDGVQMHDVYLGGQQEVDYGSSDDDSAVYTIAEASAPPQYMAPPPQYMAPPPQYMAVTRVEEPVAVARPLHSITPRSAKELQMGNTYLDRSSGSARSLGLDVGDSRFQTTRSSRRPRSTREDRI